MKHIFTDPDLIGLDRIWPLGQQLTVPENGTIVVAGAYEGRYVHYLSEMFPTAYIHGYEPQDEARSMAEKRLKGRNRVRFSRYALGTANRSMSLGKQGTDGASFMENLGKAGMITVLDAVDVLHGLPPVDLLVLNAEGSEWSLLPYLMDEMMQHRIKSLAIQFHPGYVSTARAEEVLLKLRQYYAEKSGTYPSWTLWERI